jgi:glucuronide carrier protein
MWCPSEVESKPARDGRIKTSHLLPLGYAAGDAGCNLVFSMFSMFLLLYYTDVAKIDAAAAGTLFLVVRVWDAFTDVFAGRLIDKTSTRWGKFRPFILFGSVPLLLLSMATFSVPHRFFRPESLQTDLLNETPPRDFVRNGI